MITSRKPSMRAVHLILVIACWCTSTVGADPQAADHETTTIRVATFNVSLHRSQAGQLQSDLAEDSNQAVRVASILRIVRPDIVLLNEFDYDRHGASLKRFRTAYLESEDDRFGSRPLYLPHDFTAPVNTGQPTGLDLDHDGQTDGPADAFGFGHFPGQYGMVVLSRFPIDQSAVQTFQRLKWADLPNAHAPIDPRSRKPWYSPGVWSQLRLASKSVWDVPVNVGNRKLHILASHPTPPAFDGPEDRNGRRNHDEIQLLWHLISDKQSTWLKDDAGRPGGIPAFTPFVICGDLNADPFDGGSFQNPISRLLQHPRVQNRPPTSRGAVEAAAKQGGRNATHKGDPAHDTADFSDRTVGNLRVDYCLPSTDFEIVASGVFWPGTDAPHADLVNCSDHRLVWTDLQPNRSSP